MALKCACYAQSLAITLLLLATPTTAQDKDLGAIIEGPVIKLLEQGTAPRQTLRIAHSKGMKQSLLMKMKVDQTIVMRGQKLPPTTSPTTQFTIEVDVTDLGLNDSIHIHQLSEKLADKKFEFICYSKFFVSNSKSCSEQFFQISKIELILFDREN